MTYAPDPPKHPRGVPFKEALKGLDWIGGVLFTIGAVMVLVGMVYTSYLPSTSPRVLVTLVVGFAFIVAFGCWERFSNVRFKLCPNDIFVAHKGREFTVPFCLTFMVVGYFYGAAVIYPTMLSKYRLNCLLMGVTNFASQTRSTSIRRLRPPLSFY